ncbi:hypothetical protein VNO78_13189 [Psophocarpus tetragonolobus]|uniref:RING-type E3 ubiquitin transferase n=1 Tax=Psophocarpus tetragonolobus TaxID=3891 RepID=A0AAN9XPF1_PSOTE
MGEEGEPIVFNLRRIFTTILVATSEARSEVRRQRCVFELFHSDHFNFEDLFFQWLRFSLANLGVPQSFLNGCDCDMVKNLSKMLCDSIEQRCFYVSIFITVLDACCYYNTMNNVMWLFSYELIPLSEFVRMVACNFGKHSLPAGATTLERFKVQDEDKDGNHEGEKEKDTCIICLEKLNCDDDVAKMPCSHVCHYHCILQWFVKSSTCPMCRFPCNNVLCNYEDED